MAFTGPAQYRDIVSSIISVTKASLNPGATATNTTSTATVTVTGALLGDLVDVTCDTALGNVTMQGEVTAADTVTVKFSNNTAGSITPAAGAANYNVIVYRLDPRLFV
jgi:hypothetical protein